VRYLLIFCAGCNLLFPEFDHPNNDATDAGDADSGGRPHVSGLLCVLGDLRDYKSCGGAVGSEMRVTVEETRDAAPADALGHFTLPLSQTLPTALLAAADGAGQLTPTVTTVALSGGSADGLAVPLISAAILQQVALENGVALDARKGTIFGWATDAKGNPLAGIAAVRPDGSDGPFYDGIAAGEIAPGRATSSHGLIVFFNVPPGNARFALGQTQFQLPVRANAVSLSLLVTAP
jgi:hypothetical protein